MVNFLHYSYFRVDNNHLLLLMIHVFRENEEQLFKVTTETLFFIHCDTTEVRFLGENFNICAKYK